MNSGGRTSGTKLGDADQAQKECALIEADLMELQAAYEQYFLGMERRPPTIKHNDLKKRMGNLRNTFVNSTPVKFRIQNLQQRVTTFERLWERTLMEIENGTYKRDVYKARRHSEERKKRSGNGKSAAPDALDDLDIDEDLDLSDLDSEGDLESAVAAASAAVAKPAIPSIAPLVPGIAPVGVRKPGVPPAITAPLPTGSNPALKPTATGANPALRPAGPPARPPAPVGSDGGLNEQKIKAIYDAYVMAKRRCGEDTSKLSLSTVATTLRSQVPTLMKQHNAKSVEFKVVIKDGKAVLRALPKE
ncbi:MAG: hypothetical protein IAE78_17145 [Myxococcus sp.]|nr:hypothetical protein [Myxococcus sp.]